MAAQPGEEPETAQPVRVVFRIPLIALLVVVAVIVGAIPAAFALPGLQAILLLPVLAGVWVVRNRTIADAEQVIARRTFSSVRLPWSELASLRLNARSWVRAVRTDGSEVTLPGVRLRHLAMLAAVSGGRLADPTATAEASDSEASEPARSEPVSSESAPSESAASEPAAPEPAEPAERPEQRRPE